MQNIYIAKDMVKRTPEIDFNFQTGILRIEGRSMPENPKKFYDPLLAALQEYAKNHHTNATLLVIKLEYYNTATSMYLLDILKELDKLASPTHKVSLEWHTDEDAEDAWIDIFEDKLAPFTKNIDCRIVQ